MIRTNPTNWPPPLTQICSKSRIPQLLGWIGPNLAPKKIAPSARFWSFPHYNTAYNIYKENDFIVWPPTTGLVCFLPNNIFGSNLTQLPWYNVLGWFFSARFARALLNLPNYNVMFLRSNLTQLPWYLWFFSARFARLPKFHPTTKYLDQISPNYIFEDLSWAKSYLLSQNLGHVWKSGLETEGGVSYLGSLS